MKYLLGIDNGGTFVKAALFDENGNQIASAGLPTNLVIPKPGYNERDMEELWKVNTQVIKSTLDKSGIDPIDIAGVSFSGHGKGLYAIDKNGKPAYSGIPSTDTRAWKQVEQWKKDGTAEKVFQKTFQDILPSQPVSLLAWLKENEPLAFKNIHNIFSVKDYIRYRLTGEAFAEYTDFSGANLINLTTKEYDLELLKLFGIEGIFDKLPPLKHSAELCGYVTEKASEETGLMKGTPVAAGMFDINACGIASGLGDPSKLSMIAGTWSINEYIQENPIVDGSIDLNSMYCIPGYYLIEESSPTSAGNLEWFINTLLPERKQNAKAEGKNIYGDVDSWVEEIQPTDSNLVFLPFLNGSNEDTLAKGTLLGMTMYHNRKHIVRAVFEGVVFSHLTHLKKLLVNREQPESIQLSGGVTNSDVWIQIFADALQIPIDVVADKEQGAQGAAMAAGIAVGIYKDYADAIDRCVKINKTVQPRSEYAKIYNEKYTRYRAVIDGLSSTWDLFEN